MTGGPLDRLEGIGERVRANFITKSEARERALALSREIIRGSANAIRAVHRGEFDRAEEGLAHVRELTEQASAALRDHQDIFHAGFVHDAQKEYAEARITLAIVRGSDLPEPEELGVGYAAYLNGMGEAVGELRRHLLDYMRHGEVARCEDLLRAMDDIYGLLVTIDFPDAMTGGLRRTTDAVRGILEKTRGDLTVAMRQRDLEETLRAFERRLPGSGD